MVVTLFILAATQASTSADGSDLAATSSTIVIRPDDQRIQYIPLISASAERAAAGDKPSPNTGKTAGQTSFNSLLHVTKTGRDEGFSRPPAPARVIGHTNIASFVHSVLGFQ